MPDDGPAAEPMTWRITQGGASVHIEKLSADLIRDGRIFSIQDENLVLGGMRAEDFAQAVAIADKMAATSNRLKALQVEGLKIQKEWADYVAAQT